MPEGVPSEPLVLLPPVAPVPLGEAEGEGELVEFAFAPEEGVPMAEPLVPVVVVPVVAPEFMPGPAPVAVPLPLVPPVAPIPPVPPLACARATAEVSARAAVAISFFKVVFIMSR